MLRRIRIALAVVFLAGITLLFIGIGQSWWGWMAKVQLLPATYRLIGGFTLGNLALVSGILLVTLLFGRIYCSTVCPLGVFQDIVIWLRRRIGLSLDRMRMHGIKDRKEEPGRLKPFVKHFKYSPARTVVRYAVFAVTLALAFAAGQLLISIVAPYSTYGRAVECIASLAGGQGAAPLLPVVSLATLVLVGVCAWLWGRNWCNIICPVGTLLGAVSRFSLMKIRIDESRCNRCGRCVRGCKASCIDGENHKVDTSRCIGCFDCIGRCKQGAISFGTAPREAAADGSDRSRRAFIGTAALFLCGTAVKAQEMKADGGLAPLVPKTEPDRGGKLVPPGAWSVRNYERHCTSCMLCVSACPNGVLRPGSKLEDVFRPQMGYENGYCRPECTACGDICPSGAIRPITKEEKSGIRIGTARVNPELCLAAAGSETCGNCSHHCPSGAIRMVEDAATGHHRPVVMEEQCIGCGACEALCPVRPLSAITVTAVERHIKK